MRKTILPLVIKSHYQNISIGSDEWFKWLESSYSFRYEPPQNAPYILYAITVSKFKNYWRAFRRTNGKLKSYYLGLSEDLTYEKLNLAVDYLSKPTYQSQYLGSNSEMTNFCRPSNG